MKKKMLHYLVLLSILLTSCKNVETVNENQATATTTSISKAEETVKPGKKVKIEEIFDNVDNITIKLHSLKLSGTIKFVDEKSINNFIEKIMPILNTKEIVKMTPNPNYIAIGGSIMKDGEDCLGLSNIELNISYTDGKEDVKVWEMANLNDDIYKDGQARLFELNGKSIEYANEDRLIAKTIADMIKDDVHYIHIYSIDSGEYIHTDFLGSWRVAGDGYILSSGINDTYDSYWLDYIKAHKFKLYDRLWNPIDKIPDFNNGSLFIRLKDEKNNEFGIRCKCDNDDWKTSYIIKWTK